MEKRKFPRFSFYEPVGFGRSEEETNGSLGADISNGGVRIKVSDFIPLRTVLNLKIHLSNPARVVPVKGRVVWVNQVPHSESYEVGIEFMAPQSDLSLN